MTDPTTAAEPAHKTTTTKLAAKGSWLPEVLWGLGEKYGVTSYPNKGPCVRVRNGSLELKESPSLQHYIPVKHDDVQLQGTRYWEGLVAWSSNEELETDANYYRDATWVPKAAPSISAGVLDTAAVTGIQTKGQTVVFLAPYANLRERLLYYIDITDYTHVVGWCPWVTDPQVLGKLTSKAGVCLVVRSDQAHGVAKKAKKMKRLWPGVPPVCYWQVQKKKEEEEEENAPGQGYPTLHGKVMLFGRSGEVNDPVSRDRFKPLAVWRGSCNWTINAFDRNEAEEASFCDDPALAQACYTRFLQLLEQVRTKDQAKEPKEEKEGKGKGKKDNGHASGEEEEEEQGSSNE